MKSKNLRLVKRARRTCYEDVSFIAWLRYERLLRLLTLPPWSFEGGAPSIDDRVTREEGAVGAVELPSRDVSPLPATVSFAVAAVLFLFGFLDVLTSTRPSNPPFSPIRTVAS